MATHSSILAWRIPRTEEPGRLAVYRVAQCWTWLKWLSSSSSNPLQYSDLDNSMDCTCTVHVVTKSRTWLSDFHFHKYQRNTIRHTRKSLGIFTFYTICFQFNSVQSLSRVWLFETPWTTARQPPCPSATPGVHPNSCVSSQWCHPAISSSVIPFSSCLQSFPASGSFQMSQFFASGG